MSNTNPVFPFANLLLKGRGVANSWLLGLAALFCLVCAVPALGQTISIQPNTKYCTVGSTLHPMTYCTDSTPCRNINGKYLCLAGTTNAPAGASFTTLTCWSETTDYTCMRFDDGCLSYSTNKDCTEVGTAVCTTGSDGKPMVSNNPKTGACQSYTKTYSCVDTSLPGSASLTTQTSCDLAGTLNGAAWAVTTEASGSDILQAATSMEYARELTLYGTKGPDGITNLFGGLDRRCRDGYFGLKNCCNTSGTGVGSDRSISMLKFGSAFLDGFRLGAGKVLGSPDVYSFIFSSVPQWSLPTVGSWVSGAVTYVEDYAGGGFMGFGLSAGGAAGMFPASASMSLGPVMGAEVYFNPYALAAAVAVQVVMDLMSCNDQERELATAKQQNLCKPIGSYCSNEVKLCLLGNCVVIACLETTQTFCCFNGPLARGIKEAAHSQLGLSWGGPQGPACGGLTPDQVGKLNMNDPAVQAALEPFKARVMDRVNNAIQPALTNGTVSGLVQQKATGTTPALCAQRKKIDPTTVCN